MVNEYECPETGLPVVVIDDVPRKLGLLQASEDDESLLRVGVTPDVPASRWQYVTHEECKARVEAFLKWALLDQKSHGSCVGFSAAGALMWNLWEMGFPPPGKLSGAYIYSWINGNRDAGASIVAALRALQSHGTCLESTVGWNTIYRRQIPAAADEEAKRWKLETGESLSGAERMVSALQCRKPVQFGVRAGGRFGSFDDEGVAGYNGRGSNHSAFAPPLLVKKTNGEWKAPLVNSWNLWGPWRAGWCYVDERHFDGGGGGFIHGTPNFDPLAPPPPKAP